MEDLLLAIQSREAYSFVQPPAQNVSLGVIDLPLLPRFMLSPTCLGIAAAEPNEVLGLVEIAIQANLECVCLPTLV